MLDPRSCNGVHQVAGRCGQGSLGSTARGSRVARDRRSPDDSRSAADVLLRRRLEESQESQAQIVDVQADDLSEIISAKFAALSTQTLQREI